MKAPATPVVVDLNVFIGQTNFPADVDIIFPDCLASEIAGSRRRDTLIDKFSLLLAERADRVWIGSYWGEVAVLECAPRRALPAGGYIDHTLTMLLRERSRASYDWPAFYKLVEESTEHREYEVNRRVFIDSAERFALPLEVERPDWWRAMAGVGAHHPELVAYIQEPATILPFLRMFEDKYSSEPWVRALAKFPDEKAVGRWARIVAYTHLRRTCGRPKKFENNWDDAHYAFLASYAGRLATRDNPLIAMVQTIFPHVVITESV